MSSIIFTLAPLNDFIPDIAIKNKVAKTNDFGKSLLLLAINVQELLEMIYKANTLYDKEKYKEMILDAAETVLGYFGFDRTSYGNKKMISKRKWWWMEELRQERERDIRTEVV